MFHFSSATLTPPVIYRDENGGGFYLDHGTLGIANATKITESQTHYFQNEENKFLAASTILNIALSSYLAWMKTQGSPQCGALTKGGRGCRCRLRSQGYGDYMGIHEWMKADGSYCHIHENRSFLAHRN